MDPNIGEDGWPRNGVGKEHAAAEDERPAEAADAVDKIVSQPEATPECEELIEEDTCDDALPVEVAPEAACGEGGVEVAPEAASGEGDPRPFSPKFTPPASPAVGHVPSSRTIREIGNTFNSERLQLLNEELGAIPAINSLARLCKATPATVALAGGVAFTGFLFFGLGGALLCTVVGVAFPVYQSFKAVEAFATMDDPDNGLYNKAANMQFWLTYWIAFGILTTCEQFLYYIAVWFPFYYPMKIGFLLFLFMPQTRGADKVYRMLISPILKRNQARIDDAVRENTQKIHNSAGKLRKSVAGRVRSAAGTGAESSKGLLLAAAGYAHAGLQKLR